MMDVWPHILFNRIKGYFIQSHKRTWSPPGPHWYKISALIARPAIQTSLPPLLNVKEAMFCAAPSLSRLMRMPVSPVLGSGCGWSAGLLWYLNYPSSLDPAFTWPQWPPAPLYNTSARYYANISTITSPAPQLTRVWTLTCNARNVLIRVGVRKYPVNMRIFINRYFPLR